MNTTELKKLAEAAIYNDTEALPHALTVFRNAANPAAILKLLQINAELVEALERFVAIYGTDDVRGWMAVRDSARAAIAKYEGGEL